MSNPGALLLNESFVDDNTIQAIVEKIKLQGWDLTHSKGMYANEKWRVIKLIEKGQPKAALEQFPEMKQLLTFFKCNMVELVFYSLLPGGSLHRHRDVSGTLELGRIRFHIPLVTQKEITFHCAGEDIHMKKGELWAVNTSYKHAVNNPTDDVDRIHIMMEVDVNDWVWSLLPKKNLKYYLHGAFFFMLIGWQAFKTIIFEHKKFKGRLGMVPMIFRRIFKK